jgi:hypothetical protein
MYQNTLPYLIPITAIIGAFAIAVVSMILKSRAKDRQHRERMFMAEKGLEIPSKLYDIPQQPKPNGFRGARAWLMVLGTTMVFIGIAVIISLTVRDGVHQGINGIIPLLIGVGFLASERMIARFVAKTEDR